MYPGSRATGKEFLVDFLIAQACSLERNGSTMLGKSLLIRRPTVQRVLFLFVFVCFFQAWECFGQAASDRYQLGRRLERFERAWQESPDELRAKSTASMEQAVQSFFSLQLSRAGKLLDQAWMQASGIEASQQTQRLQSLRWKLDFQRTLLDADDPVTEIRSGAFYDPPIDLPIRFEIVLKVWPWSDSPALVMESRLGQEPLMSKTLQISSDEGLQVDFRGLAPGDYVLTAHEVSSESGKFDWICPSISLVDRLEERFAKLETWSASTRKEPNGGKVDKDTGDVDQSARSRSATVTGRFLAREIARGRKGIAFEIDLPWNKLMEDFEQISLGSLDGQPVDGAFESWIRKAGWKWMQLGLGRSTQVIRMEVPEVDSRDSSKKLPVLIALHGAGGSENMFFQTYGAGRLIELAKERKWIVVSPRQTMTGLGLDVPGMIQALSEHLPIDEQRVMLVGHSMGAAQGMSQVSKHPESIRMVAALGGGGALKDTEAIRKVPFFVGAGDRDFGKPRAKSLSQELKRIGCPVEYREYRDVEHMVIVQAALDDVFDFFDRGIK
jgi:predicted esterase